MQNHDRKISYMILFSLDKMYVDIYCKVFRPMESNLSSSSSLSPPPFPQYWSWLFTNFKKHWLVLTDS